MSPVTKSPFFTHVKNDFFLSCVPPADFMPLLKKLIVMALKHRLPYTAIAAFKMVKFSKKNSAHDAHNELKYGKMLIVEVF